MKKLSKDEMKKIVGGLQDSYPGGCCVHTSDWSGYQCGQTLQGARDVLFDNGNGGWDNWCCDSCQASWTRAHTPIYIA